MTIKLRGHHLGRLMDFIEMDGCGFHQKDLWALARKYGGNFVTDSCRILNQVEHEKDVILTTKPDDICLACDIKPCGNPEKDELAKYDLQILEKLGLETGPTTGRELVDYLRAQIEKAKEL
jgi:hypothetical protein